MTSKLPSTAYRKLADLLDLAHEVRALFDQSGAPLPEELRRLFGASSHAGPGAGALGPWKPPAPSEASPDWVWIEIENATPSTLALAVLRASEKPLTVNEVHAKVAEFKEDVPLGTIANIGTRADKDGIITRENAYWKLVQADKAGVLHSDHVWGEADIFEVQEKASLRRKAILRLLQQTPLQQVQIVTQLRRGDLVPPSIPVNKSLIKADVEMLYSKGKVRRVGNSKKWEASAQ